MRLKNYGQRKESVTVLGKQITVLGGQIKK
jgi:hypothetical protein